MTSELVRQDYSVACAYAEGVMSVHTHRDPHPPAAKSREEYLAWDRPFPAPEDVVIEELTDEESDAFWKAITEA